MRRHSGVAAGRLEMGRRSHWEMMETSALSSAAMVAMAMTMVMVVLVMVARVAFSTHYMCTRNTRRWKKREAREVTGRRDSCNSRAILLFSLVFSLSLSLSPSFSSLLLPFLYRLFIASFSHPVAGAQLRTPLAIAYRSTNSGRRNPWDKPRTSCAIYTPLPFHRKRFRPLCPSREVSISRSLVRMPFPRHCRRRNTVFANFDALHLIKPISDSPRRQQHVYSSFRIFIPFFFIPFYDDWRYDDSITYFVFYKLTKKKIIFLVQWYNLKKNCIIVCDRTPLYSR